MISSEVDAWLTEIISKIPGKIGIMVRYQYYKNRFNRIGKEVIIRENVIIKFPKNFSIGSFSGINRGCFINAFGGVEIGEYVQIGPYSIIHSANHDFKSTEIPISMQGHIPEKVVIKDDVWIGAGCIILPGVVIGEKSIVAAGSVVTKNVLPRTIVGGVPARMIRER